MNNPRKILLIDDDAMIAQLIGMLVAKFQGEKFTLEHAADYESGLTRLLNGSYALCLLDYHLGTADGLQLLREAKDWKCSTPIILLTGDTREETDLAAMDGGAADFINKGDLKPDTFERAIAYAIKTADALNQLQARQRAAGAAKH
jgi:DNA-binding response OmpR family regulator